MSRFSIVMPRILKHEGGKVDDPNDPGGRTNQGVTQANYNKFRVSKGLSIRDVFGMSNEERDTIYKTLYWDAVRGDQMPVGVDYALMDGAVHSGPSQAIKWLQRALVPYYTGDIDGRLGPLTLSAVESYPNIDNLIKAVCDRRLNFMQGLKAWKHYARGWERRVVEVKKFALNDAAGVEIVSNGSGQTPTQGRAPINDAKPLPSTTAGDATAAGGVATGGTSVVVQQAQDALAPYAGASDIVQTIFIGLVVLGVLLTVGGLLLRFHNNRKRAELTDRLNLSEANPNAIV